MILTARQFVLLDHIAYPSATQQELAERIGISQSSVSRRLACARKRLNAVGTTRRVTYRREVRVISLTNWDV